MARSRGPVGGVHDGDRGTALRSPPAKPRAMPSAVPPAPPAPPAVPPPRASAYIPPTAVPRESKYHTIDMKAVRLSPEIDPARMRTQLSLRRVEAPSRLNYRRLTALGLLGVSIGIGGWWGVRSQIEETASVTAPLQSGIGAPGGDFAGRVELSRPALRSPEANIQAAAARELDRGSPSSVNEELAIAGPGAPVGIGETLRSGQDQQDQPEGVSPASEVPRSRVTGQSVAAKVSRQAPTVQKTLPAPSGLSRLSGSGAQDADKPASQDSKVWVAPSDPKAWLK